MERRSFWLQSSPSENFRCARNNILRRSARVPSLPSANLPEGRPFVVLSPHPDDETLGAGGLIAEARTDGAGGRRYRCDRRLRLTSSVKAISKTKVGRPSIFRSAQSRLALGLAAGSCNVPGTAGYHGSKIGPAVRCGGREDAKRNPSLRSRCAVRHVGERPTLRSRGIGGISKGSQETKPGLKLWAYPIWGWHLEPSAEIHQPPPKAFRIDISQYRDRKLEAIAAHASQMTDLIRR